MSEKIKQAIEHANKIIKESRIDDPELKKIAFSKAIDFFMAPSKSNSKTNSNLCASIKDKSKVEVLSESDSFWKKFSQQTNIEISELRDTFYYKDSQITLLIPELKGNNKSSQQIYLASLILFAYTEGLGIDWVPSILIAEAAKNSKVYDTSKFAKNLKTSDLFRSSGTKKGVKYKLTAAGYNMAIKSLQDLYKN